MFERVRPGVGRSSEGFEVEGLGVQWLVYREGDHIIKFPMEMGWKCTIFYLRRPKWEPPHEHETISDERKMQIQDRVLAYLKWDGGKFETDLDPQPMRPAVKLVSPNKVVSADGKSVELEGNSLVYADASHTVRLKVIQIDRSRSFITIKVPPVRGFPKDWGRWTNEEWRKAERTIGEGLACMGFQLVERRYSRLLR